MSRIAVPPSFPRTRRPALPYHPGPIWGDQWGGRVAEQEFELPVIRRGSRGQPVSNAQSRLARAGFSPGPIDGMFGQMTDAAVRAFQRARGLTVDGIVGPQTWGALGTTPSVPGPAPAANIWQMPPDVVAIGEPQHVAYDPPPAWNGGAGCAGSLTAGATALAAHIRASFPGISAIGGYNCRPNSASPSQMSVHGTGRALDIMIPRVNGGANSAVGDPIANWLVRNAQAIGVQYIIWNRVRWAGHRHPHAAAYGGPHPHDDHVHVEITNAAAARRTPWFSGRP
jgi:hypothetical protein